MKGTVQLNVSLIIDRARRLLAGFTRRKSVLNKALVKIPFHSFSATGLVLYGMYSELLIGYITTNDPPLCHCLHPCYLIT